MQFEMESRVLYATLAFKAVDFYPASLGPNNFLHKESHVCA